MVNQQLILYLCVIQCRIHENSNKTCQNACQGPLSFPLENKTQSNEKEHNNRIIEPYESNDKELTEYNMLYARIMDGERVDITSFPYSAFLYIQIMDKGGLKKYKQCSGSIIHERAILTAAHCVPLSNIEDYISVTAVVGNTSIRRGTRVAVTKIIQHEHYSKSKKDFNDLAIVTIAGRFRFSNRIYPIILGTGVSGSRCRSYLAGWGMTSLGAATDTLMYTRMTVITQEECIKKVLLANNVFCAISCKGAYPYHGDSGSALVLDGVQVGILSRGTSQVSVFTDLYYYVDWVQDKLNKEFGPY